MGDSPLHVLVVCMYTETLYQLQFYADRRFINYDWEASTAPPMEHTGPIYTVHLPRSALGYLARSYNILKGLYPPCICICELVELCRWGWGMALCLLSPPSKSIKENLLLFITDEV